VWAAAAGAAVLHAEQKKIAAARKKYPVGNVEKPCAPIYRGKDILPRERRTFFLRQKFGITKNILHG